MSTRRKALVVAGREITDAMSRLTTYAVDHSGTVTRYDLAGQGDPSVLTREEVVRTRVIASRISEAEANWFVETGQSAPWEQVPAGARLEDADPLVTDGLYDAAAALYDHFHAQRRARVGVAKISKVLHLKRPGLIPILDSRLVRTYRPAAVAAGRAYAEKLGAGRVLYWAAIRNDLVDPGNVDEISRLRDSLESDERPEVRRLAELTDLRLLDILTWEK